ncbi:MAG TPA: serine hydroxymethyltransferase [Gammaproteobacteria bacterium]|nr:serine hydroxymethyltransferase [Gammaproteobacteria bacterium]
MTTFDARPLADFDAELAQALAGERAREESYLELIASENYVSPRVLAAQGSLLTNKYADGYPGERHYMGCELVDVAERLAIERAQRLFGAGYANVQPYSGSQANLAAYLALLSPGDTLLGMRPAHGGHRTHGAADNQSGSLYNVVAYDVAATGELDYDQIATLARRHRPKLVVAGFSAYSRVVDWARFRAIADDVGALFLADIAHVAGLVVAGLYPSPVAIADVTTTTTHKTLRGPRGGMILAPRRSELTQRVDAAVFPGTQGGPLMHVIAAKAVAFAEALEPKFAAYQRQTLANARLMAKLLIERRYKIMTGGTDNHMLLVDLRGTRIDAARAERALHAAHIAVNRASLPGDAGSEPTQGDGGLRLGTPAVTTRGLSEPEIRVLTGWIADILDAGCAEPVIARVRAEVVKMCVSFPVYGAQ